MWSTSYIKIKACSFTLYLSCYVNDTYIIITITCLLIEAALLREASRSFHRGLHECFDKDYEHLFDSPQHSRIYNDVSDLSPIYIPAAG